MKGEKYEARKESERERERNIFVVLNNKSLDVHD
jgi:hypothetical protein